jgi:hypothetical protein
MTSKLAFMITFKGILYTEEEDKPKDENTGKNKSH